jgi:hypothetical protein
MLWWFCASPSLAAEPPLTEVEQREILGYLGELRALRDENAQLREVLTKGIEVITSLRAENEALRQAQAASDRVILAHEKLAEIQDKAMKAYKELAAAETLRADRAEHTSLVTKAGLVGGIVTVGAILFKVLVQ